MKPNSLDFYTGFPNYSLHVSTKQAQFFTVFTFANKHACHMHIFVCICMDAYSELKIKVKVNKYSMTTCEIYASFINDQKKSIERNQMNFKQETDSFDEMKHSTQLSTLKVER